MGLLLMNLLQNLEKYEINWFKKYFPYKRGTPSHDTLGEFFSKINPEKFTQCMISFMKDLKKLNPNLISLDGKTVRGFLEEQGYPFAYYTKHTYKIAQSTRLFL